VPLVKKVVEQSDAITAVLGPNIDTSGWREFPGMVRSVTSGRAVDLVVCTHLDALAANESKRKLEMENRRNIVSSGFGIDKSRVVFCSALRGLGAQILLKQSTNQVKPSIDFDDEQFEVEIKVSIPCPDLPQD
jgi:hypothetical protein